MIFNQIKNCLICQNKLTSLDSDKLGCDFICDETDNYHGFELSYNLNHEIETVLLSYGIPLGGVIAVVLRFDLQETELYYYNNLSQLIYRETIPKLWEPDFPLLDKLKKQVKKYLTSSTFL